MNGSYIHRDTLIVPQMLRQNVRRHFCHRVKMFQLSLGKLYVAGCNLIKMSHSTIIFQGFSPDSVAQLYPETGYCRAPVYRASLDSWLFLFFSYNYEISFIITMQLL